jgi:hypothetical protein
MRSPEECDGLCQALCSQFNGKNARFNVDVKVDDAILHEVCLPHFKRVVDEGITSVMSAYNLVNGEWAGQNHALLVAPQMEIQWFCDQRFRIRSSRWGAVAQEWNDS